MALFEEMFLVEEDGVTHINVYSKARTKLGQFLSNFAHTPIDTEDGRFASLEGYWYWLKTGDSTMKVVHGYQAKKYGKQCKGRDPQMPWDEFQSKFRVALDAKMKAFPGALRELKATTLPLAHYYVFNGKTVPGGHLWVIEHIDSMR